MAKPLRFKDFVNTDTTMSGDDELAYQAQKRRKDIPTGNTGEAVDIQTRRKMARNLKKNKAKIAMGRKRAARKVANQEVLMRRARKQARNTFMKKITKGIPKDELTFARRQEIEKRLDKMKPKIDKLARKLLPVVRKAELARKRGASGQDKDD